MPGLKETPTTTITITPTTKAAICIIGSLNIDFVTSTPRCPGPGETLTATSLTVTAGGKGGNQAVACGRASFTSKHSQDVSVSMIGAVGADDVYYSTLLKPALEASGVNTSHIEESPDAQTGSASIIVEEESGENRILVVPGANHAGMMGDVEQIVTAVKETGDVKLVVMQGEIPRKTTLGLLEYFNGGVSGSDRAHVIFNPAPVFPDGIPMAALKGTSVLIMNETEAIQMSRSIAGLPIGDVPTDLDDLKPEELAPSFHEMAHVQIVLITLGSKGVYFSTRSGRTGAVKGVKVAKLARFLAQGASLKEFDAEIESAVQKANAAAASTVQRRGAAQSIPFAYDME
ncbi:Ribokinase [Penicillium maclennaniae]|uniref:Ribokinase n=1 Tax=Penicillium maclennaniae TaxID=1343394 RepID=UPI00253F99B8|nr:Ribokinase [Penicillium maclennaniae]KAJ5675143.1 Ribokinase [Penicillium maclennaniae]